MNEQKKRAYWIVGIVVIGIAVLGGVVNAKRERENYWTPPPLTVTPAPIETAKAAKKTPTLDRAKAGPALWAEKKIVDIYWPEGSDELRVAVADDGSRRDGFAQYLCMMLDDFGEPSGLWVYITAAPNAARSERILGSALCP